LRKQILPAHGLGLPIQVPHNARVLFSMTMESIIGNGQSTLSDVWFVRWLDRKTNPEMAPNFPKVIPKRPMKCRTVALSVQVLREYILVWGLVDGSEL
jgi:hypothetical protein